MKVLIADDHQLMREGLARLLGEAKDIAVVAQASDGDEALALALESSPDVAVLDVTMPGRGGMDTLAELKRCCPQIKILMLSMHPEDQYAVRLMKEGADGYMTKESAPEELLTAIRRIHLGGKYVSSALAEALVVHLESGADSDAHSRLSHREFQVMCLLASGRTVGEIAEELDLSVKTISTYRTRILLKMHLKNTAQIMHYGLQKGLAQPQPS